MRRKARGITYLHPTQETDSRGGNGLILEPVGGVAYLLSLRIPDTANPLP